MAQKTWFRAAEKTCANRRENFGVFVPNACPNVPVEVLNPRSTWKDSKDYDNQARDLTLRFEGNFKQFENDVDPVDDHGEHKKKSEPVQPWREQHEGAVTMVNPVNEGNQPTNQPKSRYRLSNTTPKRTAGSYS